MILILFLVDTKVDWIENQLTNEREFINSELNLFDNFTSSK